MTHWVLLILAVLTSGMMTRYQYFYLNRDVVFGEGAIVSLVLYFVFVFIFNKYSTKCATENVNNSTTEV